ncbi:MAG: efflux RND transporter periplasmic adaptor subunit, partial [Methylocystis sp.]|nr:efflux RND transporter periplasmic adaptor subunit [Methylocystis sp.]
SLLIGASLPNVIGALRGTSRPPPQADATTAAPADGTIKLTAEQIEGAKIETATVGSGLLTRRITVPATLKPDANRIARVAAKVAGVVAEMRKRLGDPVAKNEVVAIVDSREVADAKSEYLAAGANFDLQSKLYAREQGLFAKKITAEQLFLKAKTVYTEAKLRYELARQKLAALDVSQAEVASLARQPIERLREKEIRSPLAGRVIERLVHLGQPVTAETQIYVVADLSEIEAELAVPIANLAALRDGQPVRLVGADGRNYDGKVTSVSGVVTPETRTGHVLATFANPQFALHPGALLNAEIILAQASAKILVPRAATQIIRNEPSVFVRTADGFRRVTVELGEGDERNVEVKKGLAGGETIAVTNTFALKAELGKSEIPEE